MFRGQTFIGYKTHKTARAVAALFYFAAVGIKNAVAEVYTFAVGGFHQQQLVETDAGVAVCPTGERGFLWIKRLVDAVNHHKVVTQSMHLGKF